MTAKEIIERAEKALKSFEHSKGTGVDLYDVLNKVNEALRLIKALAENIDNSPRNQ